MRTIRKSGFTLIEATISLVVIGMLIVPSLYAYNIWEEEQRYAVSRDRIDTIKRAINIFIIKNRILPCPASLTDPVDTAAFGVATDCFDFAAPTPGGTFDVPGASGGNIRIGTVPVRTLGLPDEYMSDNWGRRFFYAVTRELTIDPTNFRNNNGAISLLDNGAPQNSLITPPDTVMYFVASTGPDGLGGYDVGTGVLGPPCNPGAADGENCDNDNAFTRTSEYSMALAGAHFDDLVRFELKDFIALSSIKRYEMEELDCNVYAALPVNDYGEQCATTFFAGEAAGVDNVYIYIDPMNPFPPFSEEPSDGVRIYNNTFTSKTDGRLIVRATIPVTIDNAMTAVKWTDAIHAAVYVDGVLRARTVIYDPAAEVDDAMGFSSLVLAEANITKDTGYIVEVYLYSFGNDTVNTLSGWGGTIKHSDHHGTAKVEIIEIEDI